MHRSQAYLHSAGFQAPISTVQHRMLTSAEAGGLRNCLREDGAATLYSAAVSLADALRSLRQGFYTWATVKLYYAVFYTARCQLALRDTAIFYIDRSPCALHASAGRMLAKREGPTHKVVLNEFARLVPSSTFLSQTIGLEPPLEWLRARREDANYRDARFAEPVTPAHFRFVAEKGIRKTTLAYLTDAGRTYLFDPDHAMLAFPLSFWRDTVADARAASLPDIIEAETSFLTEAFSDEMGPLSEINRVVTG